MAIKKAIHLNYGPGWEAALADAAAAGFTEVAWSFLDNFPVELGQGREWQAIAGALGEAMAGLGVTCPQTHLPAYSLFDSAERVDAKTEEAIHAAIRISGVLGAEFGAYHPRSSNAHNFSVKCAETELNKLMPGYLETAEKYSTGIAIENIPVFPDHPDLLFYTCQYEDLIRIVDEYHTPRFGICWDFCHANLMKLDQKKILLEFGHRLVCTHIANNYGLYDDHSAPSIGLLDYEAVMPALKKIGYSGPLTLEIHTPPPAIRRSYYRHCRDCLDWLEGMMENPDKK